MTFGSQLIKWVSVRACIEHGPNDPTGKVASWAAFVEYLHCKSGRNACGDCINIIHFLGFLGQLGFGVSC